MITIRHRGLTLLPISLVVLLFGCSSSHRSIGKEPDTSSDADSGSDTDADTDTETAQQEGQWEWMDLGGEYPFGTEFGGEGLGIGGTSENDIVVGGVIRDNCLLHYNGSYWSKISFEGCTPLSNFIGDICSTGNGETLWAAPCELPAEGVWYILRRQAGQWEVSPKPEWWLDSYSHIGSLYNQTIACLQDDRIAALVGDVVDGPAFLSVLEGGEWTIAHEFDFEVDGIPYAVFGPSLSESEDIVVFSRPSSLGGGIHFDETGKTPLSLPVFDDDNGLGVQGAAGDRVNGYFAVGVWKKSLGGKESGFVWRSDDLKTWEEMENVPHVDSSLYATYLFDVDLDADGTVYVVGTKNFELGEGIATALLMKYDGEQWVEIDVPPFPQALPGYEQCSIFYDVWCHGKHVFVTGSLSPQGIILLAVLHYTPPDSN